MKVRGLIPMLGLASAVCASAEDHRLDVDAAIRLGLERSVEIANLRRDVQISEAMIGEVRASILPELKVRGTYTRQDELTRFESPDGSSFELGRLDSYGAAAEFSQLVYDGGSVRAGLKAARAYRTRGMCDCEAAERVLAGRIRACFYSAVYARVALEVQEASLRQLEGLRKQAEDRLLQQAASEFEALSARVREETGKADLRNAELELQRAESLLRETMGLGAEDRVEPVGGLEPVPADVERKTLFALGEKRRSEVRRAIAQVTLAEADLRVEQGGYAPEIRATASYYGQNPPDLFSSAQEWDWRWQAGLTAEWSLFDGTRLQNRVRQKRIAADKARATLEDTRRRVRLEIEQAWLDLTTTRRSAAAAAENVALAGRSLEIAGERYRQGLSTYLEFNDADLALRTARLNRARSLRDAQMAKAGLEQACGLGPLEHLEPMNTP